MKSATQTFPRTHSIDELRKARYCLSDNSNVKEPVKYLSPDHQSRSCQTTYRETDAQTSPWFPPFKTNQEKTPEAVLFSKLPIESTCFDKHDVEIIQRSRKIQEWEKYLASIPPSNIELRKTIIMKIEQDKWNFREKELNEEKERRLEKARSQIEEQRAIVQERISWRTKSAIEKWERKKNTVLPQIQSRLDRDLRRINLKMKKPRFPDRIFNKEIIDQYYSRELHLPPARLGRDPKRNYEVLCKSAYPTSMKDAYLLLEKSLQSPKKGPADIGSHNLRKHDCEGHSKHKLHQPEELPKPVSLADQPKDLIKQELEVFESPLKDTEEDQQYEKDVKLIQCLIQGRAIQNMMFRQYKENLGLMSEVSLSVPLCKAEEQALENARMDLLAGVRDHYAQAEKKEKIESVIKHLEGYTISENLDFSSKELLRSEEQKRLLILAETAEKDRWAREAAEGGRRQEEQQRLKQHEEIYKEVMKTHELTSDALMGEIIQDQVDDTGRGLATIMTRKAADIYDDVIPKPGPDPYEKLEFVSMLADRCLETQFENDQIKQHKYHEDNRFKKIANEMLSTLKNDLDEEYSTESVDTFESADVEEDKTKKTGKQRIQSTKKRSKQGIMRRSPDKEMSDFSTKMAVEKSEQKEISLIVEKENDPEFIIQNYELDNMNEEAARKLLEWEFERENSDSEIDYDNLKKIAAGDKKTVKQQLHEKEKELLKRFVEKPSLLFETSDVASEFSESTELETDTSHERRMEKIHRSQRKVMPQIIETEDMFKEKCLEKKADSILSEILRIAENYIEKYESASKKDGYTIESLQKSYVDAMTEAYRILSIVLLKSSDKMSKTALEKNLKPWINTILNEATKRMRNMFSSLIVEEEQEVPDEYNFSEEELVEPEEIDKMIEDLTAAPRLSNIRDAIPANHIFTTKDFYDCPEEMKEESGPDEEVETETESDLDLSREIKYLGVLDERVTEKLVPEDRSFNKLLRVVKNPCVDMNKK